MIWYLLAVLLLRMRVELQPGLVSIDVLHSNAIESADYNMHTDYGSESGQIHRLKYVTLFVTNSHYHTSFLLTYPSN